jgi:hypothetical protein
LKRSNQQRLKLQRNNLLGGNLLKKNSLLNGDGESLMKYLIKKRKLKPILLLHGLLQLSQSNNRKMNL